MTCTNPKCKSTFKTDYLDNVPQDWAVKLTKLGKTCCPVCGAIQTKPVIEETK